MKKKVDEIISTVIHPETGTDIASSGIIESISMSDDRISITLNFPKQRDPFAVSIKRQLEDKLVTEFPEMEGLISIIIKESAPKPKPQAAQEQAPIEGVGKIIAISSGKGGVGKSTVTANLAVTLAKMGYRTGVLDADIYGPSQAKMFGVDNYLPAAEVHEGREMIIPAEKDGVKIMSVAFFITPEDALIWRGPMATGAVRQLITQTEWGGLDYLLIDLPPGTGDIHLTVLKDVKIDGAVIVTTPQQVALADVVRGITMFRSENIGIPVLGMIENMSWFTPAELPDNRYYIFGNGGGKKLAEESGAELLGQIPLIMSIMEGADTGNPAVLGSKEVQDIYVNIAETIVNNPEISVQKRV